VASLGGYSKLSLIKAVRAVCGVSLKEAKDIVEGLQP
jgi:ribosomal protein L7/L12